MGCWLWFRSENFQNYWICNFNFVFFDCNYYLFIRSESIAMNRSTKKWLFIKISSLLLIPFMAWFIINFVSILNNDYSDLLIFLSGQPSKILFSIFVFLSFFFYSLTISEIFEDYMSNEKIKNVANRLVYIFAILLSLGTIITIYNL